MTSIARLAAEPFVLPADVEILAIEDLDAKTRALLNAQPGDFTVSRPLGRATAKVVDANTASLLKQFVTPIGIARAVAQAAIVAGADPHEMLEAAYPTLSRLIDDGFLVLASDESSVRVSARLRARDRVGRWQVQHCLRVLEDVELYEIRDDNDARFAMKLARSRDKRARDAISHEAKMLRHVGAPLVPTVIESQDVDGFPYLVMEWRRGLDAASAAHEQRHRQGGEARRGLAALGRAIVDAYAALHARGVIHGDVHDANILVDDKGRVTLLDFGLAQMQRLTKTKRVRRGGYPLYFEPEYAKTRLEGAPLPPASIWSDQYALGALLFHLFTGAHYLDFPLTQEAAWRQIVSTPPRSFAACGAEPWPELERVLQRALAKMPSERYPSMSDLAAALRTACATSDATRSASRTKHKAKRNIDATMSRLMPGGDLYTKGVHRAPLHSVSYGSAGIAYAMYRYAMLRGSAAALAGADIWATRAQAGRASLGAFYDAGELTQQSIGQTSLFYGPSGIAAIGAIIGHAAGDWNRVSGAVHDYLTTIEQKSPFDDLTIGRAGKLLGCVMLRDAIPGKQFVRTTRLNRVGNALTRSLCRMIEKQPPVGAGAGMANLGIAHGWAGMLYALLRWTGGGSDELREQICVRLDELARCAESSGRGLRWPWRDSWDARDDEAPLNYIAGWCNGSAGFVHLWLLAHDVFQNARYLELARGAAWNAWEDTNDRAFDLCCGWAGRAYAMLALYRQSGEAAWEDRARELYARAADAAEFDEGDWPALYKGTLGVALLGAELEAPHAARMPFFEAEGWPRPS